MSSKTHYEWLIERGQNQGQSPTIWLGDHHDVWTDNAHRAFMFSTREEAEAFVRERGITNCAVVEHGFMVAEDICSRCGYPRTRTACARCLYIESEETV